MSARTHHVYAISYSVRTSVGVWHSHDDYEHKNWSEPKTFVEYIVAGNEGAALGHFNHWKQFRQGKENPFENVEIKDLGPATILLEIG